MDIQVSSNFERLLFEAGGRDAASVRAMMGGLSQAGAFGLPDATLKAIRDDFAAATASEDEVAETIRATLATSGYLADPHTAVALTAAAKARQQRGTPMIVLSTAHPAKFPEAMAAITGERPALPERLAGLMEAPERFGHAPNSLTAVEHFVEDHARITKGAAA